MFDLDEIQPERIRPLGRVEYDQLVELGYFEGEKIELLRGMLVTMSPQGLGHANLVEWFCRRLIVSLGDGYAVRPGLPFAANDDSEPEPDFFVGKAREGRGLHEHPSQALLLIEVSNTSLRKDRKIKMVLYAEIGVPEYWIVNVSDEDDIVVSVYTEPTPTGYAKVEHVRDGVLRPLHLPIEIPFADLPHA